MKFFNNFFIQMKKLYILIFIGLFFLYSPTVFAQSPSKILKQANKALGGEKALRSVQSRQKKGLITRVKDGAEGEIVMRAAAPNLFYTIYDIGGFETESGFNGKSGWRRDSREGLRTLTGDASSDFQAEAGFRNNLWLNYKKEKAKLNSGGKANVNGKNADVILFSNLKGSLLKLYFDAATGLLIREEIPAGDSVTIYDYSDYRQVGAVKEPFQINLKIGEDAYLIKFDQIVHNPKIADAVFDFPKISGEPLPDISALLREVEANEEKVENILDGYAYTQKIIRRDLSKDGILQETGSETNQLSFYKGYRIRRLIEKNGKALDEKEQRSEDREVEKRVAEIEKRIAKQEAKTVEQSAKGTPDDENRRISVAEVLRASNLVNPRRERFRGRDVIVFDFEPNPNFDFKNAKSFLKFFGKTAGVIWIDEKDKQVARLEAYLADSYKIGGGLLANLRKGASFVLEQERVNNEIWLPSSADINLSVKVLLVKGINVNTVVKSYNYRKFKTEVKDAKLEELKNP